MIALLHESQVECITKGKAHKNMSLAVSINSHYSQRVVSSGCERLS
jgi:hypothetical protein